MILGKADLRQWNVGLENVVNENIYAGNAIHAL